MPTGIELYLPSGVTSLTMTDRVFKVIGSIGIGSDAGSLYVGEYGDSRNTPGYYFSPPAGVTRMSNYTPAITISGTTLSWQPGSIRGMGPLTYLILNYGYF